MHRGLRHSKEVLMPMWIPVPSLLGPSPCLPRALGEVLVSRKQMEPAGLTF